MSRISAFQENIFPASSLPRLKLVADIGHILYLFLVGIELDLMAIGKGFKKMNATFWDHPSIILLKPESQAVVVNNKRRGFGWISIFDTTYIQVFGRRNMLRAGK
jgi:hypothetical protein